jgi:hypothetical protein
MPDPVTQRFQFQRNKSCFIHKSIIPAGEHQTLPGSGDRFFLVVASGALKLKPDTQAENLFWPSQGLRFDREKKPFEQIEVFNPNSFAVYYELFVGFDEFDDRRFTGLALQFKRVLVSIYDYVASGAPAIPIDVPDQSGSVITDDNGDEFYAVNRDLLFVFNGHATEGLYIQMNGGPKLVPIFGLQGSQYQLTGDLEVSANGGGGLPMVSELYNCLPVV